MRRGGRRCSRKARLRRLLRRHLRQGRPGDQPQDASKLAAKYKDDRALLRARVSAALASLLKKLRSPIPRSPRRHRILLRRDDWSLELARSGAPFDGVVSFHGGLNTPNAGRRPSASRRECWRCTAPTIHSFPPRKSTRSRRRCEMRAWTGSSSSYGGAVHSFTDWGAGNDTSRAQPITSVPTSRAGRAMKAFFTELFP